MFPDIVCDLVYLDKIGLEKKAGKILSVLSGGMLWPGLAHICWWGQMSLPWEPPAATARGGHSHSVLTLNTRHTTLHITHRESREAFSPGLLVDFCEKYRIDRYEVWGKRGPNIPPWGESAVMGHKLGLSSDSAYSSSVMT